jgi:hypothetical protein
MSVRNLTMTWMACALVGAGALAGCLTSDNEKEPTGPSYAYPTEEAFCKALAEAECNDEVVKACYSTDTPADDRPSCVDARSAQCNPSGLTYHPEYAEECLAKRKEVLTDASLSRTEVKDAEEACLAVFSAEGEVGTACATHTDCNTGEGLRCISKPGDAAGVCETPVNVGGGGKCDAAGAVCAEGFYCAATASSANCLEALAEGDACSETELCASNLSCEVVAGASTCVAKAGNGQPCASSSDCVSGFCTLPTGGTSGVCTELYELTVTSASCDDFR